MQCTNHVMMIRPASFQFNEETAVTNEHQKNLDLSKAQVLAQAQAEFDTMVARLRAKGVQVHVIDDTLTPAKPDAVFPNNWISMHADGVVRLYPMCTPNRRIERRSDIVDYLKSNFEVSEVIDWSHTEASERFLEGTGSIVFDHKGKTAYACLSPRTEKALLEEVAASMDYEAVSFYSHEASGQQVYHTNVMMCIGDGFAVVCMESVNDEGEQAAIRAALVKGNLELIAISRAQMNQFAGNMLAVLGEGGQQIIALSSSAYNALTDAQRSSIEKYAELLPMEIPTIETIGGGSVRCMIAEVFLPARTV